MAERGRAGERRRRRADEGELIVVITAQPVAGAGGAHNQAGGRAADALAQGIGDDHLVGAAVAGLGVAGRVGRSADADIGAVVLPLVGERRRAIADAHRERCGGAHSDHLAGGLIRHHHQGVQDRHRAGDASEQGSVGDHHAVEAQLIELHIVEVQGAVGRVQDRRARNRRTGGTEAPLVFLRRADGPHVQEARGADPGHDIGPGLGANHRRPNLRTQAESDDPVGGIQGIDARAIRGKIYRPGAEAAGRSGKDLVVNRVVIPRGSESAQVVEVHRVGGAGAARGLIPDQALVHQVHANGAETQGTIVGHNAIAGQQGADGGRRFVERAILQRVTGGLTIKRVAATKGQAEAEEPARGERAQTRDGDQRAGKIRAVRGGQQREGIGGGIAGD